MPDFRLKDGHRIISAFELDGIKYFEFDDANNIPCDRAFSAVAYYEELSMKCTREYLLGHCQAVEDIISNPKTLDLTKIIKLHIQLKERLEFIFDADIIYKLASVVYFDESENPYKYDFKYGIEKISRWKKHKLSDFFLSAPIKKFLPHTDLSASDLEAYSQIQRLMTKEQLDFILQTVSGKSLSKEWYNTLKSQAQEISALTK